MGGDSALMSEVLFTGSSISLYLMDGLSLVGTRLLVKGAGLVLGLLHGDASAPGAAAADPLRCDGSSSITGSMAVVVPDLLRQARCTGDGCTLEIDS